MPHSFTSSTITIGSQTMAAELTSTPHREVPIAVCTWYCVSASARKIDPIT